MALRAGYKGFKKLAPGLKLRRPGTIAIDNDVLNETFLTWEDQAVLGSVNIAPMSLAELKSLNATGTWTDNVYTLNDCTITVNTDTNGNVISLVANGVPSATVTFFVTGNLTNTDPIRLVGCPSGGSISTYKLCIVNTSGSIIDDIEEIGNGKNIQMSQTFRVQLRVYSGATIPTAGLVFKPMLTYNLSATYADFIPYAMTNKELTEKVRQLNPNITSITGTDLEDFMKKFFKALYDNGFRTNFGSYSGGTTWANNGYYNFSATFVENNLYFFTLNNHTNLYIGRYTVNTDTVAYKTAAVE